MQNHPLQYFIDLIELKQIEQTKEGFLFVHPYHDVDYINEQEEYVDKRVLNKAGDREETIRVTFTDFLNEFLPQIKTQILTTIDLHLLNSLDEKKAQTFISYILNSINDLLSKIKLYHDAVKYPIIETTLLELKDDLHKKYLSSEISASERTVVHSPDVMKIQWNAGVASLCTLFYELANDYKLEKKGISFMTASSDQLKKFILSNFVDEGGNPFSDTSVATYLDSRSDKKAKRNKVEVDKIGPNPKD